ncbi:MAG: TonB-dependent receptor [Chitinophagaceae bacterium]|nr:TonB-dependent receptor [Chitinophagaceae bacterium]
MIFKRIFFGGFVFLLSAIAYAQQPGAIISGIVQDEKFKTPLEFASVQLLSAADSSTIKAAVTDKKGKFSIENINNGNYVLLCTFIGYNKVKTPLTVANSQRINAGIIAISSLPKSMDEVVVTSKKSLLNTSIDRKIYNVGQDIMATSGSASDILKNIPSVEVDIDGGVSLRGSSDVMILINGKPSPLMGKSRAEVLQQLPANSIERIEVITNPSSKFKPDGTAGIINIVMKKNTKAGLNGTLIGNIGNSNRYNGSVHMNYKAEKLNLFGSYSIRKDSRRRINDINREELDGFGNTTLFYTGLSVSPFKPLSHIVSAGTEYEINDHNSIGISANYSNRDLTRRDVVNNFYYNKSYILIQQYDRFRYAPETEIEKDATMFWQHNFKKEDEEIRFELNISRADEEEDNRYTNVYSFPLVRSTFDNTVITKSDKQKQVTIDYSNPLSENSKLEAGYDGSFSKLDPTFFVEYFDTAQKKFVKDISKSNKFIYEEAIHAFYTTYQHSYGAFGYAAGLRAEQSIIKGNLVTKDSLIDNQYFKFYPTLHLGYKLKSGEIQLNYSRRVNRPDEDDLNPFPEYRDPNNLQAGNPKLLPEIIHSAEFGYQWQNDKYSFVPSLYYRYKQNVFTQVIRKLNDSTYLTTQENLANDKSAGLELIFSAKPAKFFSANLSSNIFYNKIDAINLGYNSTKAVVSMSLNFNSTFVITKNTLIQISSNYRSARITPQGKSYGAFVLNTGIRQDLFKKKVSVVITCSDLFKTLKDKRQLNTPFLNQTSIGSRDARIIYFGIAYRFGKTFKRPNEEKLQFDNNL